ncbi:MAG: MATE family efflux transporter [Chitinophagaceae bacterium]
MIKEFLRTLNIAAPIIISNIAQIALLLVDSAMIGRIDYLQLASSSLVINVMAIPQVLGMGISVAISPLVAIANGRKEVSTASKVLFNGLLLCIITSLILSGGLIFYKDLLFHLGQDPAVAKLALPFYEIIAWSLIPMMVFIAVKQFTDALEFTRTGMILTVLSLPLNVFLNWVFIYGNLGMPRLELFGAGISTFITRVVIAVTLIIVVLRHKVFNPYIKVWRQAWKVNFKLWKELLQIGIPSCLQYGMEAGAFSVSGIMIGWLGATAQAAHQIALNLSSATFMAATGLSLGGSIRVANAYGRGQKQQLRLIGKSTAAGGLIYGFTCGLLFILLRHRLPFIFTINAEVAAMASSLLIFGALFQVSDTSQTIAVGLLRGIKDVKLPTAFVGIAYWVIGIPIGYFLAFKQNMGASGIWLGFLVGLTVSSLLLNTRFLTKTKIENNKF